MSKQLSGPEISAEDFSAQVALELAIQIIPTSEILLRFDLTAKKLREMLKDTGFRNTIKQIRSDWEAADNVRERVRLKAGVALEDSLINLHTIANDMDLAPAARIDAIKQLASLADAVPRKDSVEEGSRFSVTINLPNGEPVKIEAPALEGEFEND